MHDKVFTKKETNDLIAKFCSLQGGGGFPLRVDEYWISSRVIPQIILKLALEKEEIGVPLEAWRL